jgi:hypothetical protein
VLATQSLGALDTVDPQRGLRNTVFANVDHLFAFNCSAEDARQLALELGAPIEPTDLVELGDTSVMPVSVPAANDYRPFTCGWTRLQSPTPWSATWWLRPPALGTDGTPRS